MDHGQILEQPFYNNSNSSSSNTNSNNNNSTNNSNGLMSTIDFTQDFNFSNDTTQPQQSFSQIDFFYETPQFNITTDTTNLPIVNNTIDEDYVQNLTNELQHTKQLLKQYQVRTEQLMELVKKQTNKINELREQLLKKN